MNDKGDCRTALATPGLLKSTQKSTQKTEVTQKSTQKSKIQEEFYQKKILKMWIKICVFVFEPLPIALGVRG